MPHTYGSQTNRNMKSSVSIESDTMLEAPELSCGSLLDRIKANKQISRLDKHNTKHLMPASHADVFIVCMQSAMQSKPNKSNNWLYP